MRGAGGRKMSVFVQAQRLKTVNAGRGGGKKWLNFVYVVVEWPLKPIDDGIAVRLSSIYIKHNGTKFIMKSQFQEIILHYAHISCSQRNGWQTLETSHSIN